MRSSTEERVPDLEKVPSSDMAPTKAANESTMISAEKVTSDEPELIDWNGNDDPQNPQNWSLTRKWWLVGLVSGVTFNMCVMFLELKFNPEEA